MKRLSTRLVLSHVIVALVGAATVAIVIRLLVPQLFDDATMGMGMGRGQGNGQGPGQGNGGGSGATGTGPRLRDVVVDSIGTATWAGLAVSLALAGLLSWFAVRRLLGPLRRIRDATRQIAGGDYLVEIPRPAETELAALADDVTALGRTIGETEQRRVQLMSEIAHELRTPLTVIEGNVEGMIDQVVPTDPAHLQLLAAESGRLRRLADDLSSLSRNAEGRWELHLSQIDLGEVVAASARRLRPQFEDAGVTLDIAAADAVAVTADPDRIAQIVTNLVGNALRATPEGGTVTVAVTADAGVAHIRVSDTGVGIEPAELDRIFERFYRGPAARRSAGSGIGLTIARGLAGAHGGDVTATSAGPGRGATFEVSLPLSE